MLFRSAVFVAFYSQDMKRLDAIEKQREDAITAQKAADEAKRQELQRKAKAESDRRQAEQAAAVAAKEAESTARWNDETNRIKAQVDKANAETADYDNKAKALQDQLDALQKKKEQDTRDDFDLTKEVEKGRVDQETAELDNQRMIDMIANRASQSAMANYNPPPAEK